MESKVTQGVRGLEAIALAVAVLTRAAAIQEGTALDNAAITTPDVKGKSKKEKKSMKESYPSPPPASLQKGSKESPSAQEDPNSTFRFPAPSSSSHSDQSIAQSSNMDAGMDTSVGTDERRAREKLETLVEGSHTAVTNASGGITYAAVSDVRSA